MPRPMEAPDPTPPRRAARLSTSEPDKLNADDRRFVTALRERPSTIATADPVVCFATMVKDKTPAAFDDWLRATESGALAPSAAGIRRDENAIRVALTEPWSNGQVKGQVNRLKVIKREMCGRAEFERLRARVLGHA